MATLATAVMLLALFWMVARLWRHHTLVAIGSIFFWPLLLYPLATNWGDHDADIRLPFLMFVVALGTHIWFARFAA